MTRDSLLARLSDVLRRSGVEDAEELIAEVERRVVGLCPLCRKPNASNKDGVSHVRCAGIRSVNDANRHLAPIPFD